MRYVFHPEALSEYAEAIQYYTKQRVEVAQAFINAIEDAVYRIQESPTRYAAIDEDIRRCMAYQFPYGVLYAIEKDYILILAVMHCSREPGY
ncbi:MAG: type II toxin-antitoxin system RelE/ParE family toxin [Cyanobacteria bacterium P01_D01_bin.71]